MCDFVHTKVYVCESVCGHTCVYVCVCFEITGCVPSVFAVCDKHQVRKIEMKSSWVLICAVVPDVSDSVNTVKQLRYVSEVIRLVIVCASFREHVILK